MSEFIVSLIIITVLVAGRFFAYKSGEARHQLHRQKVEACAATCHPQRHQYANDRCLCATSPTVWEQVELDATNQR